MTGENGPSNQRLRLQPPPLQVLLPPPPPPPPPPVLGSGLGWLVSFLACLRVSLFPCLLPSLLGSTQNKENNCQKKLKNIAVKNRFIQEPHHQLHLWIAKCYTQGGFPSEVSMVRVGAVCNQIISTRFITFTSNCKQGCLLVDIQSINVQTTFLQHLTKDLSRTLHAGSAGSCKH